MYKMVIESDYEICDITGKKKDGELHCFIFDKFILHQDENKLAISLYVDLHNQIILDFESLEGKQVLKHLLRENAIYIKVETYQCSCQKILEIDYYQNWSILNFGFYTQN